MRLQDELQRREDELRRKEELFRQQQRELQRHRQEDMYLQVSLFVLCFCLVLSMNLSTRKLTISTTVYKITV